MSSGRTILDFGSGSSDTSVSVSYSGITSNHVVTASIMPATTVTHTADEHMCEPLRVMAGDISPGVGFTIRGVLDSPGVATGEYVVAWRVSYPGGD